MEFNLSTFLLEMVNFLALVWILKKLFLQPVRTLISERQAKIMQSQKQVDQRQAALDEAEKRLAAEQLDWQQQEQKRLDELRLAMEAEQVRLEATRAKEKEAAMAREAALADHRQRAQDQAVRAEAKGLGRRFALGFLGPLAGPALEGELVDFLLRSWGQWPESRVEKVKRQARECGRPALVSSAFALSDVHKEALTRKLREWLGAEASFEFRLEPALIAGLLVEWGSYQMKANLRDELEEFFNHDF